MQLLYNNILHPTNNIFLLKLNNSGNSVMPALLAIVKPAGGVGVFVLYNYVSAFVFSLESLPTGRQA